MPQGGGVIAVLVSGGDHQQAETNDLGERMHHPIRRPGVVQAAREPIADTKVGFDLAQRQNSGVRGQLAAIEPDDDILAGDR